MALELIPWAGHIGMLFGREGKIVTGLEKLASGALSVPDDEKEGEEKKD